MADRAASGDNPLTSEICVIGGGPAGAGVARRLATLGHRVCLIERAAFPRRHIGESLPPSILPVLDSYGLRERIERAGFLRPDGTIVHWAGRARRHAYPPDAQGFQVDRARFDTLFLDAAKEVGVTVLQPVQARRPVPVADGWIVPLRGDTPVSAIRAQYLVDAAGKHAALPRRRNRYSELTAALYGYWRAPPGIGAETRVEAGDGVWYWGAPLPDGSFNAVVFLDARRCAGLDPDERDSLYRSLLARSALLRGCLDGRLLDAVRTCDASTYSDDEPMTTTAIKVGEAAFSIDPLSSQGVQSAMASALRASIAVHTVLTSGENARLAVAFYRDRQRESVRTHARLAAGFYAEQNDFQPDAFWRARAQVPPALCSPTPRLTSAPLDDHQRVELSDAARIVSTPMIRDDLVVSGRALCHPNLERPIVYLDDLAVEPLLQRIRPGRTAGETVRQWSAHAAPGQGRRILDWLWRHGVVVPSASMR